MVYDTYSAIQLAIRGVRVKIENTEYFKLDSYIYIYNFKKKKSQFNSIQLDHLWFYDENELICIHYIFSTRWILQNTFI